MLFYTRFKGKPHIYKKPEVRRARPQVSGGEALYRQEEDQVQGPPAETVLVGKTIKQANMWVFVGAGTETHGRAGSSRRVI